MGAAAVYDAWQRVGAFLGAVGLIGLGVVVYVGPDDLPEEIPWHRSLGIGMVLFGLVFLAAVVTRERSAVGRRLRSLVLAAVAAVVALLAGSKAGFAFHDGYRLDREGVPATANVESRYHVRTTGNWKQRAKILYDGKRATMWDEQVPADRFPVLYLEDEPEVVAAGTPGDSILDLAARRADSMAWFLGSAALALLCAIWSLLCLKDFILGPTSDPDEADR